MAHRIVANIVFSGALLLGVGLMLAGAAVPSEPTVAVGIIAVFAAATTLLVVNYPSPQVGPEPVPSARIYVFPDRRPLMVPRPANDYARTA